MFDLLPWRPKKRSVEYVFGKVTLRIESTDITSVQAEALVSSDDNHLTMRGGVSRAILKQAGPKIKQQAHEQAPVRMGDVVVTKGWNLRAKHIFHCAVINVDNRLKPILPNPATIATLTGECLRLAHKLELRSIAFPALGTGDGQLDFRRSAEGMMGVIIPSLAHYTTLERVTVALWPRRGVSRSDLNNFYQTTDDLVQEARRMPRRDASDSS